MGEVDDGYMRWRKVQCVCIYVIGDEKMANYGLGVVMQHSLSVIGTEKYIDAG